MQVRKTPSSDTKVLDLTTENGAIALGGAAGTIAVTISATAMAAVAANKYRYDLELASAGGVVTRLLEGVFLVTAEVTR
jgi:methylase of polypeptide subunit release factors